MPVPEQNSNKFLWETYETPCWSNNDIQQNAIDPKEDSTSNHNFTIRHLKQGGTGARKTWEASEILLNHLLCEGGPLRDDNENTSSSCDDQIYNIMELGGGAGCVAVGLATALNHEACQRQRSGSQTTSNGTDTSQSTGIFYPKARIICTDNDKATIKNLRHNIARQPTDRNVSKTVRVASLGWGDNVGGLDFDRAIRDHFQKRRRKDHSVPIETCVSSANTPNPGIVDMAAKEEIDPLRLLTHVIASDVLYGVDALEPLSSVISAIKLRNPEITIILAVRERSPNAVANLKACIEEKVLRGLELQVEHSESDQQERTLDENFLSDNFSVSVKNVTHAFEDTTMNFQMVEC